MKNYLLGMLIFLLTACTQQVKPLKPMEQNTTKVDENSSISILEIIPELEPEFEVEIEQERSVFEWQQNDELIKVDRASKMVVVKSNRVLVLFNEEGDVLSRHRVSLGENPVGTKLKQGDKKTPEGRYGIRTIENDKKYYKEIFITYPNAEDRRRSRELGFNPGGGITFHAQVPWNWSGVGDDHTLANDWTNGCIAMTNYAMDTVLSMIDKNTIVEIRE